MMCSVHNVQMQDVCGTLVCMHCWIGEQRPAKQPTAFNAYLKVDDSHIKYLTFADADKRYDRTSLQLLVEYKGR